VSAFIQRHRRNQRDFVRSAAASFAAATLAALYALWVQYASSSWTVPPNGLLSSRSFITCMVFCFMLHAVLYAPPSCRISDKAGNPVLACVIK
jgi:hypothetical protein